MLMSPNADDLAQLCIDEGVKVITTGAGNPGKYMAAWKETGIKVMPVVPSVALAKRMEKSGADAVIAEGTESGGHIGENTTMCLVPQVVDAVEIPVIAAGGIADGRGMAAAFMLGAEGVQIGTRFLASEECQIHPTFKDLVIKAKDTDNIVTGRYTGHPCRNIKTKFAKKLATGEKEGTLSPEEFEQLTVGALRRAVVDGDVDSGSFLCGAISGMVNEIKTCADIVKEINDGAEKLLGR
jgi:enoyl-[acyl-carrier protein] reductase II